MLLDLRRLLFWKAQKKSFSSWVYYLVNNAISVGIWLVVPASIPAVCVSNPNSFSYLHHIILLLSTWIFCWTHQSKMKHAPYPYMRWESVPIKESRVHKYSKRKNNHCWSIKLCTQIFLIRETRLSPGRRRTCGLVNLHSKEWHGYCGKKKKKGKQAFQLAVLTPLNCQQAACACFWIVQIHLFEFQQQRLPFFLNIFQ